MKTKTLFFSPRDKDTLLFEEVVDERLNFISQPPHEIARVGSKCGAILEHP